MTEHFASWDDVTLELAHFLSYLVWLRKWYRKPIRDILLEARS